MYHTQHKTCWIVTNLIVMTHSPDYYWRQSPHGGQNMFNSVPPPSFTLLHLLNIFQQPQGYYSHYDIIFLIIAIHVCFVLPLSFAGEVCHIPRLHDEAGSTSWLVERSSSQLVEPTSSCKRGNSFCYQTTSASFWRQKPVPATGARLLASVSSL